MLLTYRLRAADVLRRYGKNVKDFPQYFFPFLKCYLFIHKLVTDAVNAQDVLGAGWILFDLLPDVGDMAVHCPVGDGQIVGSPNLIEKFISGNDLPFLGD